MEVAAGARCRKVCSAPPALLSLNSTPNKLHPANIPGEATLMFVAYHLVPCNCTSIFLYMY